MLMKTTNGYVILFFRRLIAMKEMNIKNAEKALTITTTLTLFIAGFEVLMAYLNYQPGMNILDIASYATVNN